MIKVQFNEEFLSWLEFTHFAYREDAEAFAQEFINHLQASGGLTEIPNDNATRNPTDAAKKLWGIVEWACGDDLERAEMAFRNLSPRQMQEEYGNSGLTCQAILDDYRRERARWQAAKELLVRLFRMVQIQCPPT